MIRFIRLLFYLLLFPSLGLGAGKTKGPFIGMHPEGDENEGPRMVRGEVLAGRKIWFRISPEVSGRHFSGYAPFAAADGTFGVALQLNAEGGRAVLVMCSTYPGKVVRIIANGHPVDAQRIAKPPSDGRIIIWQGLSRADLLLFDKTLKRFGGIDPKKL